MGGKDMKKKIAMVLSIILLLLCVACADDVENNNSNNGSTTSNLGTRSNPYNIGDTATFNGMNTIFDQFILELTMINVIRGDEAWQKVYEGWE